MTWLRRHPGLARIGVVLLILQIARQVALFYESASELDREANERAEAIDRFRAAPDLIICPDCECVQDDDARCQHCGRGAS